MMKEPALYTPDVRAVTADFIFWGGWGGGGGRANAWEARGSCLRIQFRTSPAPWRVMTLPSILMPRTVGP